MTFARDHTVLSNRVGTFSPWAVNCPCGDEGGAACSHLTGAIEQKFGIRVPDDWVHWNGGVFLFGNHAVPFMNMWHSLTMQIFEDPYWKTRDQGTLITTVWKFGLQHQQCLPSQFNFLIDNNNQDLRFDRDKGYSMGEGVPGICPAFLHLYQADLGRPGWSLLTDVDDVLAERTRRIADHPTGSGRPRPLTVIGDRLTREHSLDTTIAQASVDFRVIVGLPHWALSGESVFAATLVRGLKSRGIDAHVLLTEENSDHVSSVESLLPRPVGVPIETLSVPKEASWGGRWGSLVRYLEERAPCVYVPLGDWRNSIVSAHLSGRVGIVGIVPNGDPRYENEVERLGRYWNAIVSPSAERVAHLRDLRPELAGRIVRIAPGVDISHPPLAGANRPHDGLLRIVSHGRLSDREKRIFDLPMIVQALLGRGLPVQLTIIGDGPDRDELLNISRALLDKGVMRWLGILSHQQVLAELEQHDSYLLTSGSTGLPQAAVEAMGRGCVPVVGDSATLAGLVLDDINGYRVPVGDLDGFCRKLDMLYLKPDRRRCLGRAAYQSVAELGLRSDDMVDAYAALFKKVVSESVRGAFHRPQGLLHKPPCQVAGNEVLPVHYFRGIKKVGIFPSYSKDYEEYRDAVGIPHNRRLPIWNPNLVNMYPAIFPVSAKIGDKNSEFVTNMAQGLQRIDHPVQLLIPPSISPNSLDYGIKINTLKIPTTKPFWRPRHQALAKYLERQSPCLYLPNSEELPWSVCPYLSDQIGVIGRIDDADPESLSRVAEMGVYWNAVVADSPEIANRLIQLNPDLSSRISIIPLPIEGPKYLNGRLFLWNKPLRVAFCDMAYTSNISIAFSRMVATLINEDVPIELLNVGEDTDLAIFEHADVFMVLSESLRDRRRLLEAMGRGCIPIITQGNGALMEYVKDGENGYVVRDRDISAFSTRLSILQRNPVLRRAVSARAVISANAMETIDVFIASYMILFEQVIRAIELGECRRTVR